MANLAPLRTASRGLPAIVMAADQDARERFLEFFTSNIRNPHTRRAYLTAVEDFLDWCEQAAASAPSARCGRCTSPPGSSSRARPTRRPSPTAARCHPPPVRLAGQRPGGTDQSRGVRARPHPRGAQGPDPDAEAEGSAQATRQYRYEHTRRVARSRPAGADGLLVCPGRCCARDASGGCLHRTPPPVGPPARKRRQGPHYALPPQPRELSHRLSRKDQHRQ
jgi:hypothetical protein